MNVEALGWMQEGLRIAVGREREILQVLGDETEMEQTRVIDAEA